MLSTPSNLGQNLKSWSQRAKHPPPCLRTNFFSFTRKNDESEKKWDLIHQRAKHPPPFLAALKIVRGVFSTKYTEYTLYSIYRCFEASLNLIITIINLYLLKPFFKSQTCPWWYKIMNIHCNTLHKLYPLRNLLLESQYFDTVDLGAHFFWHFPIDNEIFCIFIQILIF